MTAAERIARLVPKWVQEFDAYRVEDSTGLIKLDAMENPYPFPPALRERWIDVLAAVEPNRYPDPSAGLLKDKLRATQGLDAEVGIALGNGSDELIHLLCMAFAGPRCTVLCPEPTFAVYRLTAQTLGMTVRGVPLRPEDFALDIDAMLEACDRHQPALVFLASPNNPTGNRLADTGLAEICAATPGLVVLDEAYIRFSAPGYLHKIVEIENLVVMQTMSKIGLAGLRLGMLFGDRVWVDLIEKLRMPYNVNALSQAGVLFALDHSFEFEQQIARIVASREALYRRLRQTTKLTVWPSETNFLLFRSSDKDGTALFEALKTRGVLVKNLTGTHPLLADCIRLTVGTAGENEQFYSALVKALG